MNIWTFYDVKRHDIIYKIGGFCRYTFTGKEKDQETGYGYFGARYMDHELMTMWLSVDPMADKYPSISSYAYCAWNPLKLVDPDGRDFEIIINHKDNTIKICAQFICSNATEEQQAFLQKAVKSWNLSSFVVSLPGEDGSKEDYTVSFDINKGNGPTNTVSFIPDMYYDIMYSNYHESGGITDGQNISIRASVSNNQLLAHEMGHCLGLYDTESRKDCLMFASNTGNEQITMLSSFEQIQLLAGCGFNNGGVSGRSDLCVGTTIIGKTPYGFWNTNLKSKNFTKNNTKHFVK